MLALVGFAVGYVVGAREGKAGLERMINSTKTVLASDEFKAFLEGAQQVAGQVVKQGMEQFGGVAASGGGSIGRRLRAA